jgi:hypothetical protein
MSIRRIAFFALFSLAATLLAGERSTLYDRVDARLSREPDVAKALGKPSPEIERLSWMLGRWKVAVRVAGQEVKESDRGESVAQMVIGGTWLEVRDSYQGVEQDVSYLTYNIVTKEWIALGIDKTGNAVTATGKAWDGDRLTLLAQNATVVGERVTLRQVLERISDREYVLRNEEQLPSGSWALVDEYVYRKQ